MSWKLSRRAFAQAALTGLGGVAAALGFAKRGRATTQSLVDNPRLTMDNFPRIEPGRVYSPPPSTMGEQMGRVQSLNLPALGYEMDGDVKVFRLTAQPVRVPLTRGMKLDALNIPTGYERFKPRPSYPKDMVAWGYNGGTPGPTIEATEGDLVRIIVRNELPEPTSVHWHGVLLPFAQDGAAGYAPFQAHLPILPGEERAYEFQLIQHGTCMYHAGFNPMKQEGMGLGGMFVIHPRDEKDPPDHDFSVLLQQYDLVAGSENPNITSMEAKFATMNGRTAPDIEWMRVKQGDRVRIRLGNLSLMTHPIHLHGYTFKLVGSTGAPIPPSAQYEDVTVAIAPGQVRDIELVAWNPGTWRFHCHILHHIMNAMTDLPMGIAPAEGMFTHLHVEPKQANYDARSADAPWEPSWKQDP